MPVVRQGEKDIVVGSRLIMAMHSRIGKIGLVLDAMIFAGFPAAEGFYFNAFWVELLGTAKTSKFRSGNKLIDYWMGPFEQIGFHIS